MHFWSNIGIFGQILAFFALFFNARPKNTIKAEGSTSRARSKMSEWSGVDEWIPLRLF